MSILIGADIVPTKTNYDLFESADLNTLFGEELLSVFAESDMKILNLETPISDVGAPIAKNGPALVTPERVMPGIKALGVDLLSVANNHIVDYGAAGFNRTIEILNHNGINFVGGGSCLNDAAKPFVFNTKGKTIGVYSCAEHEFSIAGEDTPGANPFDPLESLDHISKLRDECDYVIVLYHGGKEHYRYPSPNLQKTCRKIVEKGADLVICQHSHCIGCVEKYNGCTIVYGQGNFIFDYSRNECWKTGLLIRITDEYQIEYIPIKKSENVVRIANGTEKDEILSDFFDRSEQIKKLGFVEERFCELSKQTIYFQLATISKANGFLFRVLNKFTKQKFGKWYVLRKFRSGKYFLENTIECESLRELFIKGLEEIGGEL